MPIPGVEAVGAFLGNLMEEERLAVSLVQPDGTQHPVSSDSLVGADGFLPVFLEAAEAVWEDATGGGFGVQIGEDPAALLGYRVEGMADVPFCVVTLAMLHAIECAREGGVLRVNALVPVAMEARARARVGAAGPDAEVSARPGLSL